MGYVPLPPLVTSAEMALAVYERRWTREMRGRTSRLPWRRRRAYAACLALIRARDAALGFTPDPWAKQLPEPGGLPPPAPRKPAEPTYSA